LGQDQGEPGFQDGDETAGEESLGGVVDECEGLLYGSGMKDDIKQAYSERIRLDLSDVTWLLHLGTVHYRRSRRFETGGGYIQSEVCDAS